MISINSIILAMSGLAVAACGRQPAFMAAPAGGAPAVELASEQQIADHAVAKGSYIVMFRGENTASSLYFSSFNDEYQHHYLRLQDGVMTDNRIKDVDVLWALDLSRKQSSEWTPEFDVPSALRLFWDSNDESPVTGVMTRVDFSSQEDAADVLNEWNEQGLIWYAEPNTVSTLSQSDWKTYGTTYTTLNLWWHTNIKLAAGMNAMANVNGGLSESPIVAVLDSGVDYANPLLSNAIWENAAPGASGCENDIHGCDTTSPSKGSLGNGNVWPVGASGPGEDIGKGKGGHGTHVAGIVAATASTSDGVGGVCPVCKVMIVKIANSEAGDTNSDPKIRDDSQIRGFKYITRFKKSGGSAVRIANSSFGKYSRSRSISILVDALAKIGNGTIVIAAASNEDSMIRSYPAALNNAIAVAALDEDDRKASYSNFGSWVDIAAPGTKINSTWPGTAEKTHESSGTSMASPVVAGAAGLFLAVNPNADLNTLRSRLLDSADGSIYIGDKAGAQFNAQYYFPKIAGEDARRPLLGSGILDVQNLIADSRRISVGKPLDRVTTGCSTIGSHVGASGNLYWLSLLLTSPLFVLFLRRKH